MIWEGTCSSWATSRFPARSLAAKAVGATGGDFSFQIYQPGQEGGFYHTHKNHEELYFVLSGKGEYQVDGVNIPPGGSVVRVAPAGKRTIHNNGSEPLVVLCVQYRGATFSAEDATDGVIQQDQGGVVIGSCRPYAPRHGFYPSAILLTIRGWHLRYYHI